MSRVEWVSYWVDGSLSEDEIRWGLQTLDGVEHIRQYDSELKEYVWYPVETRPRDYTFIAELTLDNFEPRRAMGKFIWRNVETGDTYPMRVTDAVPLLKYLLNGGSRRLRWRVEKRGGDYGLAPCNELPEWEPTP
jgi:hypothetical protein